MPQASSEAPLVTTWFPVTRPDNAGAFRTV